VIGFVELLEFVGFVELLEFVELLGFVELLEFVELLGFVGLLEFVEFVGLLGFESTESTGTFVQNVHIFLFHEFFGINLIGLKNAF